MKTIAYTCSYEYNDKQANEDLSAQNTAIRNFCKLHEFTLDEIFTENNLARDDFKPELLNLMSNFYGTADKIIVANPEIISRDINFREWVQDEFKRMNVALIYITENEKEPEITTSKKIKEIQEKIKNIPSLPEIITKSMEIMQDKNASAFALSKVISNDIGLTARVLKLVNSSYYGFPKQVATIRQAIIVLGFTTVKGLILSASIFKMFNDKNGSGFDYKTFWKHSLLVATGAKLLAQNLNDKNKEDIFSAAFLHDIGKVILAKYDMENYVKISKDLEDFDLLKNEELYCGLNHCEIAGIVAYSWNLPQIFCDIISCHHNPMLSENYKNACLIVHVINVLVNIIIYDKIFSIDSFEKEVLEKLNIGEDSIYNIYNQLRETSATINDINTFFN